MPLPLQKNLTLAWDSLNQISFSLRSWASFFWCVTLNWRFLLLPILVASNFVGSSGMFSFDNHRWTLCIFPQRKFKKGLQFVLDFYYAILARTTIGISRVMKASWPSWQPTCPLPSTIKEALIWKRPVHGKNALGSTSYISKLNWWQRGGPL